jgi:hypothetical protein
LKMGPIGFPEASVDNHQSTLRNIPEEWKICCCILTDHDNV